MTAHLQRDADLAVFEAEILYLCADLGFDVLSRAIGVVDALRAAEAGAADEASLAGIATAPGQLALDAVG